MVALLLRHLAVEVGVELGDVLVMLPPQLLLLLSMLRLQSLYLFAGGGAHGRSQSCDLVLVGQLHRLYFFFVFGAYLSNLPVVVVL